VEIVRLRPEQIPDAAAVLARAFQDDPAWSWVIPDPARREKVLPRLFRLGFELIDAELWTTTEGMHGCSRWLAPGRPGVNAGPAVRAIVATPWLLRGATSRFLAYGRAVDNLRRLAAPVPHWYLAGIGVEPDEQRRGIGGALMAPGIEAAERDGVPCALLTNSEQNLSFYEAQGFVTMLEGQTPRGGPRAWMMVRQAPTGPARAPSLDSPG
jgi:ribosomal protein S18 acetylase RimI-like enzyme